MDPAFRARRYLARKTSLPVDRGRTKTVAAGGSADETIDSCGEFEIENRGSMMRIYVALLRLYPRDYRAMFAREMRNAFEIAADQTRAQGMFVAAELIGLIRGAVLEWIAKLTTDRTIRGRALPDLVMMRPPGVTREVHFAGPLLDD